MQKEQLSNIYQDLLELSDPNFQRLIWKGLIPNLCSSYVELMCRLFDNDGLEEFVKNISLDQNINQTWIAKLKGLVKELHEFNGEEMEVDAIIASNKWVSICTLAKDIVSDWSFAKYYE